MHRWLLVLMLLLLPLRGLVGEVMAGQMLQQHVAAAAVAATGHDPSAQPGHHAETSRPAVHDCDEHRAAAVPDHHEVGGNEQPADCPTCATCQACSSVALSAVVSALAAERAAQAPPHTVQRDHPSAEPALAFKPPRG